MGCSLFKRVSTLIPTWPFVFFFWFFSRRRQSGQDRNNKERKNPRERLRGKSAPGSRNRKRCRGGRRGRAACGEEGNAIATKRKKWARQRHTSRGRSRDADTKKQRDTANARLEEETPQRRGSFFALLARRLPETEVGFLTNTHTHTLTVSYTPHLNVPRGALVLPLSSIWETVQGPGERERGSAQVCYALRVWRGRKKKKRKKKGWYKSDPDSRQNHGLLSHKHMRLCGIIFRAISCWLTGVYCAQHNTTMLFIQAGKKLHSRDGGKRRWRSKIAESPAPQGLRRTPHYTRYFPRSRWIRVKRRSIDM